MLTWATTRSRTRRQCWWGPCRPPGSAGGVSWKYVEELSYEEMPGLGDPNALLDDEFGRPNSVVTIGGA
jgi:hypothetical protein